MNPRQPFDPSTPNTTPTSPTPPGPHRPVAGYRTARAATAIALAASLAACYVVPIDPRTGQPYPAAVPARDGPASLPAIAAIAPSPTLLGVRLYPLNAQAARGGLLSAQVLDDNAGHGTFSVPYLGDTLRGESSRVDAANPVFGRVHQQVLGATPRPGGGRRGIANAFGARGVSAQCEYLLTGPGAGTGVCQFSDGAHYQMHFGG